MCAELLSQRTSPGRAAEIIRGQHLRVLGKLSPRRRMMVARQIDLDARRALRNGPRAFFQTYMQLINTAYASSLIEQELARQP